MEITVKQEVSNWEAVVTKTVQAGVIKFSFDWRQV